MAQLEAADSLVSSHEKAKEGDFQTRRRSGKRRKFHSLREAMADAKDNKVWEVSFSVDRERVRLVKTFVTDDLESGTGSSYIWVLAEGEND